MKKSSFVLAFTVLLSLGFSNIAHASIFSVWADASGDGVRDTLLGTILGYSGNQSGSNNYNYSSASGHPIHGPSTSAHQIRFFMYERNGIERDHFNVIGGRDNGGHTGHHHRFDMDIDVWGSVLNPSVALTDDNSNEFSETGPNEFQGRWRFRRNTDGGVINGLQAAGPDDPYTIRIALGERRLNRQGFFSADGSQIFVEDLPYDTYFISTAAVPEPATMMLFSSGLLGAFIRRRRK